MIKRRRFIHAGLSVLAIGLSHTASAEDKFPSKPLRIIVTFGAGGSGDLLARALGQELGDVLGQPVIVENRAGGNAIPGTEYAAKAPADGYTILEYSSTLAVNMALQPGLPYDLFRDFTPIAYTFEAPLVLLTPATGSNKTVKDLIAFAKANPKGVSFGHGGVGSMSHLSGELFKRSMGIDAVSVAYKGNSPAMADLIGGRLDYYFATMSDVLPNIKSGRLNAVAVTSNQRDPLLPNVPTMVELGYKDFTPTTSWGFMVPKSTPPALVNHLRDAIAKALGRPVMQERLTAVGANSKDAGGPEVLTAKMKAEIARWEPVIKAAQIKPE
ncbi:tripartite tricarboxylate transporter substrate binding protein [Variovorax sp. Sphag1AA]|uniref:Bug family tripartite tricarboxylate transporter substrate binding protein n=1 Tax=Variovorax sp. Sphag1AA TaxID=2587027 RepID=UPI001617AF79|nr:tripartite tricarboxylate transporter substrate binding protein [Variovorax sp. Sphag1AA]MBB3181125.1 tripartite-type tricarboxylate transporter receptor subunit TctC [Variovorax sp. Sphag1AA]